MVINTGLFGSAYHNRRVLITGINGFKGSWLGLWLHRMGAEVSGIALEKPSEPCHFDLLPTPVSCVDLDIRKPASLQAFLEKTKPEIIFHLAAQTLVRESYRTPIETFMTNIMGTAHLLEAVRHCPGVKAVVVVTSDKCYENEENAMPFKETDKLGGYDPYSASKACAELVSASYRRSYFSEDPSTLIATARAGNVIGGGDWAKDRLIPDLIRGAEKGIATEIRSPGSVRPWQHVLESLSGYLLLGSALLRGDRSKARAWNFGPTSAGNLSVTELLEMAVSHWDQCSFLTREDRKNLHESETLVLNSEEARTRLQWDSVWDTAVSVEMTMQWYREWYVNKRILSEAQIIRYIADARNKNLIWTKNE